MTETKAPPAGDSWRKARAKKNRRSWCGGHEGREHEPEIRLEKGVASRRRFSLRQETARCRWTMWFVSGKPMSGKLHWSCSHEEVCTSCGRILRPWVSPEECPEFVPGPTEQPVETLRCRCEHTLEAHDGDVSACATCTCRRFSWCGEVA